MSASPDLSFAALSAWVAPMADDAVVGYARRLDDCPLARFATDQGFREVSVTVGGVTWLAPWNQNYLTHTPFSKRFVDIADTFLPFVGAPLTAGHVHTILAHLAPTFGPQEPS